MKQGWEIKKLGEVCEIICGQDYKSVKDDNGKYPIYGTGGIMGYADDYICEANTVIIGRKGSINKPIFVESPFWNVDTAFGLVANQKILMPKYLYYFCVNYDFCFYPRAKLLFFPSHIPCFLFFCRGFLCRSE